LHLLVKAMMRNYLFLILTLLLPIFTQAQIEGLWIVTKVQVGEETPTPVAKWFDLKADGKLLSGNGGIINTRGNWSQEKDQLLFQNERGQANPAGPFQIQKEENTMTWTWEEEGMLVTIHLQANQSLPKASWDYLYGNWQIAEVWRDGKLQSQLPDADQPLSLFFRWDHQYTVRNASDDNLLSPGIWQVVPLLKSRLKK